MSDFLIVGGGVIGLSLAYELASHGLRVRVIDAAQPGHEASWAGAGILPPAYGDVGDPLVELTALSNSLHAQWSAQLRDLTQIDNGYLRSGAVYVVRDPDAVRPYEEFARRAGVRRISIERLSPLRLAQLEPALCSQPAFAAAWLVPDECQIRNPRHLKALLAGCAARGVEITPGAAAEDFELRGDRIVAVRTRVGRIPADRFCLASGAWTAALAARLGTAPAIRPIRGQMILLSSPSSVLTRIINEGSRYLVPRTDGRLLVGSTEEDAGFERSTTAAGVAGLLEFALGLAPALGAAEIERSWAGLRPATTDRLPYLGQVPGWANAYVAAGHYRGGLQLSTGTAVVMSELVRGLTPSIDLSPFRLDRHDTPHIPPPTRRPRRQVPLG